MMDKIYQLCLPLVFCFLLLLMSCSIASSNQKETILAIFAHPDDETTIAPVLAKYASQGHDVYLVISTDGQFGVTEHFGMSSGDTLAAVRDQELACSCAAMGIHPPIRLGLQDGMGLNCHGNFYEQVPKFEKAFKRVLDSIQPTKIITYGPDGDTGHPDHRLVGMFTTEVLLKEKLLPKIDLYHFGWTKRQAEKYVGWNLGYVPKEYLDTAIPFNEEEEEKGLTAIRCHRSQYTKAVMDEWIKWEKDDPENVLYFRKFSLENGKQNGF